MATGTALEPIAVWDVNRGWDKWKHRNDAIAWNKDHLPDQGNDTHRIEFYLIDAPFARVFRYATDSTGHRYLDPATDEAAVEDPVIVPLSELPPPHLRCFQT